MGPKGRSQYAIRAAPYEPNREQRADGARLAGVDGESRGVVVEDFGEMTAQAVEIGGEHFADPARRWAVVLDTGNLVFANTDDLVPE